jgi:hypothetical protein
MRKARGREKNPTASPAKRPTLSLNIVRKACTVQNVLLYQYRERGLLDLYCKCSRGGIQTRCLVGKQAGQNWNRWYRGKTNKRSWHINTHPKRKERQIVQSISQSLPKMLPLLICRYTAGLVLSWATAGVPTRCGYDQLALSLLEEAREDWQRRY